MMRTLVAAILSLAVATSALAETPGPLPPGKPAGVHQAVAQSTENTILIGMMVIGAGISAMLVAHAVKGSSSSAATSTSP